MIVFEMEQVDVGPRVMLSTITGLDVLQAMGFVVEGRGTVGAVLDARQVCERSQWAIQELRKVVKQVSNSTTPHGIPASAVMNHLLSVRWLAKWAVRSKRKLRWVP